MVFDVFPTTIPVITLPAKPTEVSTTDWAAGYDKAYVLKFVSDSATSLDKLLELNLPVADESLGADTLIQHEAHNVVSDLGSGIDILSIFDRYFKDTSVGEEFPAKILLKLKEYATGSDLAILGVSVFSEDSAIASEIRLSPIFKSVIDESCGSDLLKYIEKICKDIGSGVELSKLSLLARDLAEGYDIAKAIQVAITKYDSAIGKDIRLSPVFISTTDLSSGYSALSIRGRVHSDSAIGIDIGYKGYLVKDTTTGYEFVKSILRIQRDVGHGLEIRLSPIPIKVEDISKGVDISKLVYREYLAKDEAIGYSIVAQKTSRIRDIGCGLELAVQTISAKEVAKGLEKIVGRSIQIGDSSFGIETRLSPIPLWLKDTSKGVEKLILDKEAFVKDISTGIEKLQIRVPLPTQYEIINMELSTNVIHDTILRKPISNVIRAESTITVTATPKIKVTTLSQFVRLSFELKMLLNKVLTRYIEYAIRISEQLSIIQQNLSRSIESRLDFSIRKSITTKYIDPAQIEFVEKIPIERTLKPFANYKKILNINEEFRHYLGRRMINHLISRVIELQELIESVNKLSISSENKFRTLSVTDSFRGVAPKITTTPATLTKSASMVEDFGETLKLRTAQISKMSLTREQSVKVFATLFKSQIEPIALKRFDSMFGGHKLTTIYLPPETYMTVEEIFRGLKMEKGFRYKGVYLYEGFILSLLGILTKVLESYKHLLELDVFCKKMRYVGIGDPVLPSDINVFKDAFELFVKFAETLYNEAFKGDEDVKRCLDELKECLEKFKKVWHFEITIPTHRNQVVNLIMKARKFLETAWEKA